LLFDIKSIKKIDLMVEVHFIEDGRNWQHGCPCTHFEGTYERT
jgi:hypothetical protein